MEPRSIVSFALLVALGVSAAGIIGSQPSQAAVESAAESLSQPSFARQNSERDFEKPDFFENINHDVENTENGVIITVTSDDAEAVEHIQSRLDKEAKHDQMHEERHSQLLEKHPELAEKMAEKEAKRAQINRDIELIDNGIQITISTDNPDLVEEIQERAEDGPNHGKRHHGRLWRGHGQLET